MSSFIRIRNDWHRRSPKVFDGTRSEILLNESIYNIENKIDRTKLDNILYCFSGYYLTIFIRANGIRQIH